MANKCTNVSETEIWKKYSEILEQILRDKGIDYSAIKSEIFSSSSSVSKSNDVLGTISAGSPVDSLFSDVINDSGSVCYRIKVFNNLFAGREDVYARRSKAGNYYPKCLNYGDASLCGRQNGRFRSCSECNTKKYDKLSFDVLKHHLESSDNSHSDRTVGRYVLRSEGKAKVLIFDFDNHGDKEDVDWRREADTVRKICRSLGIFHFAEISRSGKGAHIWICFSEWIPASKIRLFGRLLLEEGAKRVALESFSAYDCMFPAQDYSDGLGSLIALPLQGDGLKSGRTAFVDENWEPYKDQWKVLCSYKRIDEKQVDEWISLWNDSLYKDEKDGTANIGGAIWKKDKLWLAEDVSGAMQIL